MFLNNTERCDERSQAVQCSRHLLHIGGWPRSGSRHGSARVSLQIQDWSSKAKGSGILHYIPHQYCLYTHTTLPHVVTKACIYSHPLNILPGWMVPASTPLQQKHWNQSKLSPCHNRPLVIFTCTQTKSLHCSSLILNIHHWFKESIMNA